MATFDPTVRTKPHEEDGLTIGNLLYGPPADFVRNPAFVAIIDALLDTLRNPYLPKQEAYIAVRRATRILTALVDEAERKPRPSEPPPRW
jgi:hypothetical protein